MLVIYKEMFYLLFSNRIVAHNYYSCLIWELDNWLLGGFVGIHPGIEVYHTLDYSYTSGVLSFCMI